MDKTMKTSRVLLRKLSLDMLPFLTAMYTKRLVRKYLGGALDKDEAVIRATVLLENNTDSYWVIYNRLNQSIGMISLDTHHDSEYLEISYQLDPEFWGQGFATEAVALILKYAFVNLKLPLLLAETQAQNNRSKKLLNRFGFIEKCYLKRFGEEQILFSLSSEDYKDSIAKSQK